MANQANFKAAMMCHPLQQPRLTKLRGLRNQSVQFLHRSIAYFSNDNSSSARPLH